jgi:anti-sigma factor (TIGR02949 family)
VTGPGHVLDRLDDYIDGELSPDGMRLVGAHLSSCDHCATQYREALRTVETVRRRLRRVAVPPNLRARLRAALRELSAPDLH